MSATLWGALGVMVVALAACSSGSPEVEPTDPMGPPDSTEPAEPGSGVGYEVRRSGSELAELLEASHRAWDDAVEIDWGPAAYETRFRSLWTVDGLAVLFAAVDEDPWHTLTERDAHLWNEEVVEIFIDPDGDGRNYAEIEINPINVVCDLQIFETNPQLRSDIDWDFAGLRSRVVPLRIGDGEPSGWIATAVLPWEGFAALADTNVTLPPRPGDQWDFNVFRIKRPGGPQDPERDAIYAPWSPTPSLSFHAPSAFREMEFVP